MVAGALGLILLGTNLVLLWTASIRIVSTTAPRGLDRALAAAVTTAALMVAEAIVLGLVGLGTDQLALSAVSLVIALAAVRLPRPTVLPREELWNWVSNLDSRWRLALAVATGLAVSWGAWFLYAPAMDIDSTAYHLPEVAIWVNEGSPGAVHFLLEGFPVGNYPVTNEVLMAWIGGVSASIAPVLLWSLASLCILLMGVATTLRSLGARRIHTALALIAIACVPIVFGATVLVGTDLAATAWLVVCAALANAAAREDRSPQLIGFAVVAFGLAVGTKTTTALLGLVILAVAFRALLRGRGRLPWRSLALGVAAAVLVGGVWYLRNFIDHGSPLWPFVALPIGDPLPSVFEAQNTRFLENPLAGLAPGQYRYWVGFAPILILGGLVLPLFQRDKRLLAAAGVLGLAVISWLAAPYTGDPELGLSTTRYLMPVLVMAAGVLAILASAPSGAAGVGARVLLSAGALWGLGDLLLTDRDIPPTAAIAAGAIGGLAAALALTAVPRRLGAKVLVGAASVACLVGAVGLARYPAEYLSRYADDRGGERPLTDTAAMFGELAAWLEQQPGYADRGSEVSFYPSAIGPLTGGDFSHDVRVLAEPPGCADTLPPGGWLIVFIPSESEPDSGLTRRCGSRFALRSFEVDRGYPGELRVFGPSASR